MTHDEMIEVIQAHKDGKIIQSRNKASKDEWMLNLSPLWSFYDTDYRIKPESREFYVRKQDIMGPTYPIHVECNSGDNGAFKVREVLE